MGEGKGWCAGDLGFEPGNSLSHSPTQNPVSSGLATGEGGFTKLNYRQHTHNNYTTGAEGTPGSSGGRLPRPNGGGILMTPVMGSRIR
jgi:hypothetical protein